MSQDYQVCPNCGAEFTMAVSVCSDCGAALVSPDSLLQADAEELASIEELSLVRVSPLAWTRALSEHLSDAGIPHRIERGASEADDEDEVREKFGFEIVYGVYVPPDQFEEAAALDAELFATLDPKVGEEMDFELGEGQQCPACEATLRAGETECPECGLHFPDPE